MRSRAESSRGAERVLRAIGVLALLAALAQAVWQWRSPAAASAAPVVYAPTDSGGDSTFARRLIPSVVASGASVVRAVSVELRTFPDAAVRGVLGAVRASGVPVHRVDRWRDRATVDAMSVAVISAPSPRHAWQLTASVRAATQETKHALRIRDAAGVMDSLPLANGDTTIAIRFARAQGPISVELMASGRPVVSASTPMPTPLLVRAVRLYARPGWEAKFTSAALEESGWAVDGVLVVSPSARVQIGGVPASRAELDTARHSAALVLDSGVVSARALQRFVQQGGGVILAGEALRDPALASIAAARVDAERPAIPGALLTTDPQRGLAAFRLVPRADAITLQREEARATVVAARVGTARIIASGFRATWRWRMEGLDESAELHRRWWSGLVSAVAWSPDTMSAVVPEQWPGDVAPVADLVARLGVEDSTSAPALSPSTVRVPLWVCFLIATVALVGEWAMRRLRGAP